jgi:hypothetical protein
MTMFSLRTNTPGGTRIVTGAKLRIAFTPAVTKRSTTRCATGPHKGWPASERASANAGSALRAARNSVSHIATRSLVQAMKARSLCAVARSRGLASPAASAFVSSVSDCAYWPSS